MAKVEVGVLLPHFSRECTWERLIGMSGRIEELGFGSVWARDNLSYRPHGFEFPGFRFVDPFVTLSAIAGRTSTLKLGTCVVAPIRHPLVTAQLVGSLAFVSKDRFEFGIGAGGMRKAMDVVNIDFGQRAERCRETVEVLRALSEGELTTYDGRFASFTDVVIDPVPPKGLKIWYGGGSDASMRRALQYADGILPARVPFRRWSVIHDHLTSEAAKLQKTMSFATEPLVSVAATREQAEKAIEGALPTLKQELAELWKMPFDTAEDLRGSVLLGTPDDVLAGIAEFAARGAERVILDCRLLMDRFEDVIELIGSEVLPKLG